MKRNVVTNTQLDLEFELIKDTMINTGSSISFIDSVKKANRLPISLGEIYYSDNMWDFSPYIVLNVDKHSLKINFGNLEQPYKDDIKNYALLKIIENKQKIQTIRGRVLELRKFLTYAISFHVFSVEDISLELMKQYIETRKEDKTELGIFKMKKDIKSFYVTYSSNFKDILKDEYIRFFDERNMKLLNALRKQSRTADIPADYFNRYLSTCISMMHDEILHVDYRTIACLLIIESQTGLRINETIGLNVNALKTVTIFTGEESNYLTYKTWKRESGNNVSSTEITYINALSKEAFLILKELHKEKRGILHQEYLYMGSEKRNKESDFPLDYDLYIKDEQRFYIQMNTYLPTLNLNPKEYPTLVTKNSIFKNDFTGNLSEPIRKITCPGHHQFRVHCCTELYNKGVPLQYIQRFMGHLSNEMKGYYVRPKDTIQEDLEYSMYILKDIVSGNAKLLGGDKGMKDKIDQYISENNLTVEKDLETICKTLSEKIPIRQKMGGVCIKSSVLRECSIDAKTNDFYCAYGVCPNIFHFYYMVDISYRQAKELDESIRLNSERGLIKQVQKEINMLHTIATQKLRPEIIELMNMITKKGVEQVYIEHPEVQPIVENLATIEKEVSAWITSS